MAEVTRVPAKSTVGTCGEARDWLSMLAYVCGTSQRQCVRALLVKRLFEEDALEEEDVGLKHAAADRAAATRGAVGGSMHAASSITAVTRRINISASVRESIHEQAS